MRLPVFVASWQIECCADPVSVGDQVDWGLVFVERTEPEAARAETLVELDLHAEPWPGGTECLGKYAVTLRTGALTMYWDAPRDVTRVKRLRGEVHEDHHGDFPPGHPTSRGLVRRIRVEERDYEKDPETQDSVLILKPTRYRDVTTSPKWFRDSDSDQRVRWAETGILVDLEVPETLAGRA